MNDGGYRTSRPLWTFEPAARAARLKHLLDADTAVTHWPVTEIIAHGMAAVLGWSRTAFGDPDKERACQQAWLLQQSMQPLWDKLSHDLLQFSQDKQRRFLIFKGQALGHVLYPDPALRSRSDLDILVPPDECDDWHNALLAMGFRLNPSRQGRWVSFQNTYIKDASGGRRLMVDLHWQINNRPDFHRLMSFPVLQQRAVSYPTGKHQVPTLAPVDALQLAVFHYFAHRPEDRKRLWLYDVALLWSEIERMQKAQGSDQLLLEMQGLMMRMAFHLQQTFVGEFFPVPADKRYARKHNRFSTDFLPYAATRHHGLAGLWRRWRSQPTWRGRFGLLADYLFQPPTYVQNRYGIKRRGLVWLFYPLMWAQDFSRLLKKSKD